MKNFILLSLMAVGILLKFCVSKKDIPIVEVSKQNQYTTISPLKHGFNTESLYFSYKGETSADKLIKGLKPAVLRFPGGTPANLYHIDAPGYGYSTKDLELMVVGTGPYRNAEKSIGRDVQETKKHGQEKNHAEDFVRVLKNTNAQVVLVANLLGDDEDILKMIRFFKGQNVSIAGVELGNEYYLKAYRSVFPDVTTYISRAERAALLIHQEFPELKLGVVAAPSSEIKTLSLKQRNYYHNWNQELSSANFYNAFITHVYAKNLTCDNYNGIDRFECYLANTSQFISRFTLAIEQLSVTFKNKPAWITEWNIKSVFDGIGNSTLQTLYYADFSLALASSPNIELATYHNLLTSSSGYNIIARNTSQHSSDSPSHIAMAAYAAAEIIAPLYNGDFRKIELKEELGESEAYTLLRFDNDEETLYFVINKTRDSASLDLLGLNLDLGFKYKAVVGKELDSSIQQMKEGLIDPMNLNQFRIQGLSLYRISLPK